MLEDAAVSAPMLERLPSELIQHILGFLDIIDLAQTSATSRSLCIHCRSDQLWQTIVNSNLPKPLSSPSPFSSFRELWLAFHPCWFLTRHRLWVSDAYPSGKLLLARYDPERTCIEAFALGAERGIHNFELWTHDREVAIHSFHPRVKLDLTQPVLKLTARNNDQTTDQTPLPAPSSTGWFSASAQTKDGNVEASRPQSIYSREVSMDCSPHPGLCSNFLLARDWPARRIYESTQIWPALTIPAPSRARNTSGDKFASTGHQPTKFTELSQNTFRIRKWAEFRGRRGSSSLAQFTGIDRLLAASGLGFAQPGGLSTVGANGANIRMGEEVSTFGTLLPEAYTPTAQKPWRGIWCGDYSGHGCEFLVLLQPDPGTEEPLPAGMAWMEEWLRTGRRDGDSNWDTFAEAFGGDNAPVPSNSSAFVGTETATTTTAAPTISYQHSTDQNGTGPSASQTAPDIHSGRLMAVKLTGDPYIPRGQYTFIAPNLGDEGLVRTATEDIFRGARIVRGAGHIAGRGFRNDEYMPSQLILLSHDRLAQYWEGFGHVAFYQRVDVDELLASM